MKMKTTRKKRRRRKKKKKKKKQVKCGIHHGIFGIYWRSRDPFPFVAGHDVFHRPSICAQTITNNSLFCTWTNFDQYTAVGTPGPNCRSRVVQWICEKKVIISNQTCTNWWPNGAKQGGLVNILVNIHSFWWKSRWNKQCTVVKCFEWYFCDNNWRLVGCECFWDGLTQGYLVEGEGGEVVEWMANMLILH